MLLWKSAIQKLVASSFDIGYMVVLPLAGRLGANTDANKLMGWGGGLLGLATILFPPMANYTFVTATIVRILAGMSAVSMQITKNFTNPTHLVPTGHMTLLRR